MFESPPKLLNYYFSEGKVKKTVKKLRLGMAVLGVGGLHGFDSV